MAATTGFGVDSGIVVGAGEVFLTLIDSRPAVKNEHYRKRSRKLAACFDIFKLRLTAWAPAAKKDVIRASRSMAEENVSRFEWLTSDDDAEAKASGNSKSDPVEDDGEGALTSGVGIGLVRWDDRIGNCGVISSNFLLTPLTRLPNCLYAYKWNIKAFNNFQTIGRKLLTVHTTLTSPRWTS